MQSKRTQKIHQILQQQGYYNLQMPVIKEVLMLLEQPNTIIPMQIRLYTINGFLELTAGQRNNFKKYFFSKKFKPISQSTKMYVTRLAKVIHRMQLAQDLEQKIKNDHSNRQLHCPLVKVPQNQHERLNQENSDNQIQPFTIRLIKKHKKEQQSQMIDEMENKKALQKDNQLKIYSKNTDASVQTDLILLNDEFQTYRLDQKAHLHTQKIDFVQQIQVENQKEQKRIIIERQDKKDIILLKNDVAQLHKQKYILTMNEKNLIQYENMAQPLKQTFLQTNIQNSFSKCICKGSKQQELFYRCFFCKNSYHFSCHNKSAMGYQYQHCPQCTLRQIQPKTQIQEVISQQFFQNANSPFLFKAEYNFKPYQYYCGQKHRQHQIQVRCLKLSRRQEEVNEVSWPNQCQIRLDGQRFFEMASIDDKNFQKRKGFPLKLSEFLYFQEKQIKNLNKVTLELIIKNQQTSTNQQDSSFYLIGIYFTKNLTFENLCTKIQGRVISSNKPYMQNLLSNKIIEDTQIGKITFSLLDPYSWNTIKYPVRGVHCRHGQCFDLETYLNVMYSTRYGNWKCPLCKKTTLMLEKDLLQQSILQKLKQDEGIPQEIVYDSNGKIEVTMFNFKEEDSDQQNEMKPKQKKNKNKKKEQKNKQIKFQEYNQLGIKMYNEYSF